jgi:hypothetical chaperone protein
MIIGMDFGTTNSGMATYDGRAVEVLPLDPSAANPKVARTAIYITNDQSVTIGRAAIDLYFEHNLNRPTKVQKVWVGEIEVIAEGVYYVTDVYVYSDALSPGRLFLSVKTGLRDKHYAGTVIGQFFYTLEDLIALYLTVTKARAEQAIGQEIKQVVLGRLVHFAADTEGDRLAESRLLQSAFRAGYEQVYLQYEPIAAAYSYALELTRPENVLIFDFGGGTLDLTVMRLGDGGSRVLATGGIPVAGDVFDQKLVRAKLPRHFGEGSLYGPRHKALTIPKWIYDAFADWQTIMQLQSAENKQVLREIAQTAQRRYQIDALLALVSSNYGLKMFDIVEGAKRTLSDKRGAEIALEGPGFNVREFVTRGEFEEIIRGETRAIEHHVLETVQESSLQPGEIDTVIRTGGSALIPAFHEILGRHFGEARVRAIDTFSSVTAGLGITGHHLEQGDLMLTAHTPADFAGLPVSEGERLKVRPVNLDLLQRRIRLEERGTVETRTGDVLVLLGRPETGDFASYNLRVQTTDVQPAEDRDVGYGPFMAALRVPFGAQLLLVTSRYRFLLTSARQLVEMQEAGLGIENVHRFASRESICTLTNWPVARSCERLLFVTSTGYVRAYPLDALSDAVGEPVPFQFNDPPPGVPVLVQGVERHQEVVVVTAGGRAVRRPLARLPLAGMQAINPGRDEAFDRVTTALANDPDSETMLLLADGYARRFLEQWVEEPARANAKGKVLVVRKSPAVALAPVGPLEVITTRGSHIADGRTLPMENSTKAHRLVKLVEEEVTAVAWRLAKP